MNYRRGTAADVAAIVPMLTAHYALHAALDPARFTPRAGFESGYGRWLAERAGDARSVFVVAETEAGGERGVVVGFVVGTVEREIGVYVLREYGFVHDLWVEEGYRNEGVGRQLVMLAVAGFRELGVRQVRADTAWGNTAARGLFERAGFRASTVTYLLDEGASGGAAGS